MKTKTEALEAVTSPLPLTDFKEGDRVSVDSDDDKVWIGQVGRLKPGRSKLARIHVKDADGELHLVKPNHIFAPPELQTAPGAIDDTDTDEDEESDSEGATDDALSEQRGGKDKGFNQYSVKWNPPQTNFELALEGGPAFYGWVRKTTVKRTDEVAFCVDMYAKHGEQEFPVESIVYTDGDPRHRPGSMNADICAAANRWWFGRLNGSKRTLDDVLKQASQPTIHVRHIETIDRIIRQLMETRNTAIRCGGHRLVQLVGDTDHPPVNITVDVSAEAAKLKGKVPSLDGTIIETEGEDDSEDESAKGEPQPRRTPPPSTSTSGNVHELLAQLKSTKDAKQQRMLRATLRKMGHRGGARAIEARLAEAGEKGKA